MSGRVTGTYDGAVGTIVIDNPSARNALDLGMYRAIPELVGRWTADPSLRAVVIRGAGETAFSAGGDISEFESLRAPGAPAIAYNEAVTAAERALESCPVPVIAQIHGACVGGGCGIALACDLRLTDSSAKIGVTAARMGLVYGLESTRRLVDAVGGGVAMLLLGTARLLVAEEALRVGLVDEVHEPDALGESVAAVVDAMAGLSSSSIRGAKRMIRAVARGVRNETDATVALRNESFLSADYREGVRAFLDRRAPVFRA